MCTLITVSREVFATHRAEIVSRIREDAIRNPHGFGILLMGHKQSETLMTHCMDVKHLIATLKIHTTWNRAWIHTRYATGSMVNIFGCHPFTTIGEGRTYSGMVNRHEHMVVMHNGVLTNCDADNFLVDSMYIPHRTRMLGAKQSLRYLKNENYANVFMINPLSGEWYVSRSVRGSLYMDRDGRNYSTNPVPGLIEDIVPENFQEKHRHKIESYIGNFASRSFNTYSTSTSKWKSKQKPAEFFDELDDDLTLFGSATQDDPWDWRKNPVDKDKIPVLSESSSKDHEFLRGAIGYSEFYEGREEMLISDLEEGAFDSPDEFIDLAEDMGWIRNEMPDNVNEFIPDRQRKWLTHFREESGTIHLDSLEELCRTALKNCG